MKKIFLLLSVAVVVFGQTRLEMKDDFVNSCYSTAIANNPGLDEGRVADYCKCVFDITAYKMTTADLVKADNAHSKQNKTFMDIMAKSIDKCLYNIYAEK